MEELSLVFFTVFAQGAVGLFLILSCMKLIDSGDFSNDFAKKSLFTTLGLVVIAGIASLTHLGQPLRAINTLRRLGEGSPLSLEVFLVALFAISLSVLLISILKNKSFGNMKSTYLLCSLIGIMMVLSMTNVYKLSTVSPWNSIYTTLQFFMSVLLLGFVSISYFVSDATHAQISKFVKIGSMITVALYLVLLPLIANFYGVEGTLSQFMINEAWFNIRLIVLGLGVIVWFGSYVLGFNTMSKKSLNILAIVLIFSSELLGRVYFYDLLNLRAL